MGELAQISGDVQADKESAEKAALVLLPELIKAITG